MTLGRFIEMLEAVPGERTIYFDFGRLRPDGLMSYRGYYERLALGFSTDGAAVTVNQLLEECRAADGKTFQGYKGGDYKMDRSTPLHVANYGDTSETHIVRLRDDGYSVTIETAWIDD